MNQEVFISYASKDKEVADTICKSLEKDGVHCWIAPRDVPLGVEYANAIIEALNTCRVFLIILSEESNTSPQVRREVERAVSKDLDILTFRIDNAILSKAMEYYLSNRHWLDASNAVLAKQLHSLSEAVRKLLSQSSSLKEKASIPEQVKVHEPAWPVPPAVEVPSFAVPSPIPAKLQGKRRLGWIWAPILLLVLAALFFFGWLRKEDFPFFSRPTATNTQHPSPTINYSATWQASSATLTERARDPWIGEFAEPVLSQVASRYRPDFQDDFSNADWSYSHWNFFEGVTIENGQAVIAATDQWQGMGLTASTSDFVVMFKFTSSKPTPQTLLFGFSYRADTAGEAYNHFTIGHDGWCGFGEGGPATSNIFLSEYQTCVPNLEQTTKITILVQGDQAAAYINDQPTLYLKGLLHAGNEISLGASVSEGTATITIDDVELWNLNK